MPDREGKRSILTSQPVEGSLVQDAYAALVSLKSLLGSSFTTDELAHQMTARIRPALKIQCVALWLADDPHTTLSLRAFACADHIDILPKNYFYRLDKPSQLGECLQKGKPSTHKKYTLADNDPRIEVLTQPLSSTLLPLTTPTGAIGVMEMLLTAEKAVNKDELDALEALSAQVTLLLLNNQSADRLSRQSEHQNKLYEITGKLNSAKDYESILKITVEGLASALNLPAASMHINLPPAGAKPVSKKERH